MSRKPHLAVPKSQQLDRLVPLPEVMGLTSLSKATIYRRISEEPPSFPVPRKIGKSRVTWRQSDIAKWLGDQPSVSAYHDAR